MEPLKDIVVIYHDRCHDGFGAAWAAWVKFGEKASYIPAGYGDSLPDGIEGKDVYVVDFSYSGDTLSDLEKKAKNLMVIDHHEGARERVLAVKSNIFNTEHSGAYLAWEYFHEGLKIPKFIEYLSESDIFKPTLPNFEEVTAYLFAQPRTFLDFNRVFEEFEDENRWQGLLEKGRLLLNYREIIIQTASESVDFIDLDGIIIPAVNVSLPMSEKSYLLHTIYKKYPHISMSYRYHEGEWRCSLRSDTKINCIDIAKKFGGTGHPGSAGFSIKAEDGKFPFRFVSNPFLNK